jgi:hypothetical protein
MTISPWRTKGFLFYVYLLNQCILYMRSYFSSNGEMEAHIESQTEAYGQRGAAENSGEKPGEVAEKHPGAGCEAMIERIRSQREKTADTGTGRNSEVRRNSSGMAKSRRRCCASPPLAVGFRSHV